MELATGGDGVHGIVQPYSSLGLSPKSGVGTALKDTQGSLAVPQAPGLGLVPCQPAGTGWSLGTRAPPCPHCCYTDLCHIAWQWLM